MEHRPAGVRALRAGAGELGLRRAGVLSCGGRCTSALRPSTAHCGSTVGVHQCSGALYRNKNAAVHRCLGAQVYQCMGASVQRCQSATEHRRSGEPVNLCTDAALYQCQLAPVNQCSRARVPRCQSVAVHAGTVDECSGAGEHCGCRALEHASIEVAEHMCTARPWEHDSVGVCKSQDDSAWGRP